MAWSRELGSHFRVHLCWELQGNSPVLPEFSSIVSNGDVKHFLYWTLISQFRINQLPNFLLDVRANDYLSHCSPPPSLIYSGNLM